MTPYDLRLKVLLNSRQENFAQVEMAKLLRNLLRERKITFLHLKRETFTIPKIHNS